MKMHNRLLTTTLALCATSIAVFAQGFEEPPTLDAALVLRPEYVKGQYYRVQPPVPTYAGHNQFVIESDFGTFEADGNTALMQRVGEINAIAELRKVSRTDQYKEALEKAAKSPIELAKNLAKQPVKTITGVPKGMWKYMKRAGQSVKELGEEREPNPYEDSTAKSMIGFSKTKRALASRLGVDPYSSNETLQRELNGIGWATYGGEMTINLALAPVGGGAGLAITSFNVSQSAANSLRDTSPNDLRRLHQKQLTALGIKEDAATTFINNPAFSPTHAALIVEALEQLRGVEGLTGYVRIAAGATDEADALFFQRTAQLLASVHRTAPLAAITEYRGFPIAVGRDGSLVVALEWDYVAWTENAASFVQALQGATYAGQKITGHHVVLTGVASPRAKEELAKLKITVTEKALPGPLL